MDKTIQFITERALKEAVDKYHAKSGMAIVANPKTGAVLAIANYPFFNPNSYKEYNRKFWRNRVITDSYEPGSIIKMFLAAAAIEFGICTPASIFFCENGEYRIGKNIIHDSHAYEWLTLTQIVKFSSNIGIVKVSETLGKETIYNTLLNFGFGKKTGIDFPGETSGILSHYIRWTDVDAATIGFGQGISVSAIQLIAAASTIANGGILMKPYIVHTIIDKDNRIIKSNTPKQLRRVISQETATNIRDILIEVTTENGTGKRAALELYTICGKTGTAQKAESGYGYLKGKYIASFLGFAPAKAPEIVILVTVDEPEKHSYGGIVAGPVFKQIAHETLNYLGVPHKKSMNDIIAKAG
eukprot:CAMPEP_0201282406 /NCGR_PEP_ID=MMETSP1317-20130820/5572_1 /ASSEMBLY_ACC=CAM_ASM_000770 /TAXON_ID=187299 /ORGANISM="Undescribed Undescribed, Strain Undescribed" /LENGTH=355 /DNA_ID=CAMNT_0047594979 /DNA_START=96 /DNA_END=1163 /DNA_ORIENTATION=-